MLLKEIATLNESDWTHQKIKQKTAYLHNGDKVLITVHVDSNNGEPRGCSVSMQAKSGKFLNDSDFNNYCYDPDIALEFADDPDKMNQILNVMAADTKKMETEQTGKEFADQWVEIIKHELRKHNFVIG